RDRNVTGVQTCALPIFYKTLGGQSSPASAKYQNKVYYIKKQAKIGSETFYLLSTSPSATKDLLGWMNAKDVDSRTHKTATKTARSEERRVGEGGKGQRQ